MSHLWIIFVYISQNVYDKKSCMISFCLASFHVPFCKSWLKYLLPMLDILLLQWVLNSLCFFAKVFTSFQVLLIFLKEYTLSSYTCMFWWLSQQLVWLLMVSGHLSHFFTGNWTDFMEISDPTMHATLTLVCNVSSQVQVLVLNALLFHTARFQYNKTLQSPTFLAYMS